MKIYIKANNYDSMKIKWRVQRDLSIVIDGERRVFETYTWEYDRLNTFKITPDVNPTTGKVNWYVMVFNRLHRNPMIGEFDTVEDAFEFVGSEWFNYIYEK